jgi:hypothetical protein
MWRGEGGAIAVITALGLTVIIGLVGLAVDVNMWYRTNRALQNAADSAVIAASFNGTGTYASEAQAVTAQYGFVDGAGGITVTALNNQTCPSPSTATDCYKVTVAQASAPLFFAPVLGISAPAVSSDAMASASATHNYCLVGLASSGKSPAIQGNGAASANMNGCSGMSNTDATCNGHDLGATYVDAHGTNTGCGISQKGGVPTVADPDASLASNIPANPCGGVYYLEPTKHGDPPLINLNNLWGLPIVTTSKTLTDPPTLANGQIVCGDLKLNGNVTLTTPSPGSVLVIENGRLDTNGYTLKTASGSALTIIFSGTSGSYNHFPTDSTNAGTLDFMAPASGTWKGIAIYQDPALTTGVDITYAGNNPTWNITGVVYLPHSSVAFKGAVNKSSYGVSCLLLVADNVTISGTAAIEQTTAASCATAGVTLPTDNVGGIALVL